MSKKLFFLMAFVVVLSMFSAPAFATDYHIDPVNGSDTTGDGSFGNPWETFANIQYYYWYLDRPSGWVQLQPGETIYLMNGIHNTPIDEGSGYKPCIARFRTYHGSPGNWFRIAAYPGHSPVIDGQHSNVGINVFQSSYWEIEGVEIINGLPWGMDIAEFNNGKVHNVNIHDTIGYDNEAGLHLLGCDEIEIYDSVFYDNFNPTMVSSEPIEGGSNIITFGGEDCTIHDCLFYQSQPFPTDLRQVGVKNKHASRSPGGTFKVYNNTFIDCRAFAFQSGTEGTHFHHNLIVGGCDMAAIRSLDGGGYTHQVDQTFEYNTLYDASEFVMIPTMTWRNEDFPDDPKNINFNNNIIYDTDTLQINIGRYMSDELYYIMVDEFHSNYNCYYNSDQATQKYEIGSNNQETQEGGSYTLSQWQTNFGWDLNSTESDPLFVDAPNGDFHLQAGSPAAGMGMYAGTGPQPPSQASNPNPANSATDVSVDADLSWTAGSGSTSSDVYFGTDSTPDSGELQGNQTATTFDPGTLNNSTTYYWQIDEINAEGTTTGNVWSFTTEAVPSPPGQASNPSPANSASDVSINADLSWTAGSGATSHDVYFGTTSPGAYQGNQTATTFDTGAMANDTTYYWRIDEVNAQGTTTGVVWSFTTAAAGGTGTGLTGEYYDNMDFTSFVLTRVDSTLIRTMASVCGWTVSL